MTGKNNPSNRTGGPENSKPGNAENDGDNAPPGLKGARIIAYNVSEEERPGGPDGLKVRWKWRIETGRKARTIDARQAEAIRKALQWLQQHPPQQ